MSKTTNDDELRRHNGARLRMCCLVLARMKDKVEVKDALDAALGTTGEEQVDLPQFTERLDEYVMYHTPNDTDCRQGLFGVLGRQPNVLAVEKAFAEALKGCDNDVSTFTKQLEKHVESDPEFE